MLIRRIVMSACALCIAIPSVASASAATDPPKPVGLYAMTAPIDPDAIVKAKGPYGATLKAEPPNLVKAKGPYGSTVAVDPKTIAEAKGPYGTTAAIDPKSIVEAKGPYGVTLKPATQNATRATAHAARASSSNDWRTTAISEAALLAGLALGSAWLLSVRHRAPRLEI